MKRNLILAVMFILILVAMSGPATAEADMKSYLVIATRNNISVDVLRGVSRSGGTVEKLLPHVGMAVVNASGSDFSIKAARIRGVRAVVPNLTLQWIDANEQLSGQEDFDYPPDSGNDDSRFDLQWGHIAVDAPGAWEAGQKGSGVRVAVLDTGFDLDHPDLVANINFDLSKSFVDGETLQYMLPYVSSHGSHTAGTIAAADNAIGTIGIAPEAELLLVKVLSDLGDSSFDAIIEGIIYAADNDADVINMSLGGLLCVSGSVDCEDEDSEPYTAREAVELKNAIARATTYAFQKGSTVIAAAGNSHIDFDHTADLIHLPSDNPHVISISATSPIGWLTNLEGDLDIPTPYTNYGQSAIDFAAPGGDFSYIYIDPAATCTAAGLTRPCYYFDTVYSVGNNGWYWNLGTSMAAAHASGVAAIIIGANGGEMHPNQVRGAIKASADDLGKPGHDEWFGHGRVNAGNYFK